MLQLIGTCALALDKHACFRKGSSCTKFKSFIPRVALDVSLAEQALETLTDAGRLRVLMGLEDEGFQRELCRHHRCPFGCFGRKIDGPGLPVGLIIYQGHLFPRKDAYGRHGFDEPFGSKEKSRFSRSLHHGRGYPLQRG